MRATRDVIDGRTRHHFGISSAFPHQPTVSGANILIDVYLERGLWKCARTAQLPNNFSSVFNPFSLKNNVCMQKNYS